MKPPARGATSSRVLVWWFGLMAVAGTAFGLVADRRPFGDDALAHPLVVFFTLVGVALLIVRFLTRRPVPDLIPERLLLAGCFVGLATFLLGNWFAVHLMAAR